MATRAQIHRLQLKVAALAAGRTKRIVVQGPDETSEQALRRVGLLGCVAPRDCIFVITGVPR